MKKLSRIYQKSHGVLYTLVMSNGSRTERLAASMRGDLGFLLDPKNAHGDEDILILIHSIREFLGDSEWAHQITNWSPGEESNVFDNLWDLIWLIDDKYRSEKGNEGGN